MGLKRNIIKGSSIGDNNYLHCCYISRDIMNFIPPRGFTTPCFSLIRALSYDVWVLPPFIFPDFQQGGGVKLILTPLMLTVFLILPPKPWTQHKGDGICICVPRPDPPSLPGPPRAKCMRVKCMRIKWHHRRRRFFHEILSFSTDFTIDIPFLEQQVILKNRLRR